MQDTLSINAHDTIDIDALDPAARRNFWEGHYQKQLSSGMSRRQYSDNAGLGYDRFSYWVQKFRQEAKADMVNQTSPFAQVQVASGHQQTQQVLASIELKHGCILRVHDVNLIKQLISL